MTKIRFIFSCCYFSFDMNKEPVKAIRERIKLFFRKTIKKKKIYYLNLLEHLGKQNFPKDIQGSWLKIQSWDYMASDGPKYYD